MGMRHTISFAVCVFTGRVAHFQARPDEINVTNQAIKCSSCGSTFPLTQ